MTSRTLRARSAGVNGFLQKGGADFQAVPAQDIVVHVTRAEEDARRGVPADHPVGQLLSTEIGQDDIGEKQIDGGRRRRHEISVPAARRRLRAPCSPDAGVRAR